MDADTIKVAVAGGVTLITSLLVLWAGLPRSDEVAPTTDAAPVEPERSAPAMREAAALTAASTMPHRPRILTGEPGIAEQRKPAPRRALKLVAGITALAVAGAVGLLAFVRALISMFDSIGG